MAILAAGAAVLLLAALLGPDPGAQLLGRAPRYEGAFVLALYLGAGVAGARLLGSGRARGSTLWFLRCLALGAAAIATEAVLETAGLRPLASSVARPGSLLGNASDEGAWAVLALGPLAATWLQVRNRWLLAGTLAAGTALVCSGSRGALLGALAVAAVLALMLPARAIRLTVAGGVACLLVAALALPATRTRMLGSGPLASETVTGRTLLWGETLRLLGSRPVLGIGPNGYLDAIPAYHTAHYERVVGSAFPPDSPHDWILQAAVDGGLPLLALALGLAALTGIRGRRAVGAQPSAGEAAAIAGLLAGLAGYGTALLFHLTSPGTTPLAAVYGGALLAGLPGAAGADRAARAWAHSHALARRAAIGASALLAVVMALAAAAEIPLRWAIADAASGRLAAADSRFRLAHALRPWDPEIDAIAGHAFATLARDGVGDAIEPGRRWAAQELSSYPDSIQALSDAAVLELARGDTTAAAAILARARRLEPANPVLEQLARIEAR